MLAKVKNLDRFTKNVIFVFAGTFLTNVLNLVYLLLIAHKFSPQDFAAFNSLYAIYLIIIYPLSSLQLVAAKYSAKFNAKKESSKITDFLSYIFSKSVIFALLTFVIFVLFSSFVMHQLRIDSISSGYILAIILALSWLSPILKGGLQGLELFGWLMSLSIVNGITIVAFTVLSIILGFQIAGALGALLISIIFGIVIGVIPLRKFLSVNFPKEEINYKEIITYVFPILISSIYFSFLVRFDMVLVRYYFSPENSGIYSLAQMVGKIFLLLPAAISIVMFPRVSGLHALKADTTRLLKKVLGYSFALCAMAVIFYNCFPGIVLKVLTGKVYPQAADLGRVFSVSMTIFALLFVFINYFLSIHDFRFIKYLGFSVILQFGLMSIFHRGIFQIQYIMLFNSIVLFIVFCGLAFKKNSRVFFDEAPEEAAVECIL